MRRQDGRCKLCKYTSKTSQVKQEVRDKAVPDMKQMLPMHHAHACLPARAQPSSRRSN